MALLCEEVMPDEMLSDSMSSDFQSNESLEVNKASDADCDVSDISSTYPNALSAGKSSDTLRVKQSAKNIIKQEPIRSTCIINSGYGNYYSDILFVPDDDLGRYYSNVKYCKFFRRIESDEIKFPSNRKFICQKSASKD
jgi:hypothetical protein